MHVVHWSNGGLSKLVQELAARCERGSAMVLVLVDNGGEIAPGLQVTVVRQRGFLAQALAVRRAAREFRPDVVHVHSFTPLLMSVLMAPSGVPLIRTVHNNYPYFTSTSPLARFKRLIEGRLQSWRRVQVVAISADVAARLPWPGSPPVIDNGIDFDVVDRAALEPGVVATPESPDSFVLACVGRLEEQKNCELLLKTFALVSRESQRALALWLIGSGSRLESLKELARTLGIDRQVQFFGHSKNPYAFLRSAHMYVSCSRYEGFNLALVEAMSLGLPAVATRSGGVTESLVDGRDLSIVDRHEPDAVAKAILGLLGDADRRRTLAEQGRTLVRARYSLATMVDAYKALYVAACARPSSR